MAVIRDFPSGGIPDREAGVDVPHIHSAVGIGHYGPQLVIRPFLHRPLIIMYGFSVGAVDIVETVGVSGDPCVPVGQRIDVGHSVG